MSFNLLFTTIRSWLYIDMQHKVVVGQWTNSENEQIINYLLQ